uniref:AP-5 complex subunit mu-1-like isoform X1 n=1 Tax=Myxine glutinosa TaxID=7769 RepID=UPI00358E364B
MSIRALWVVQQRTDGEPELKLSRRYPTVERRAKILLGPSYTPTPSTSQLLDFLRAGRSLGPLVTLRRGSWFLACLPLARSNSDNDAGIAKVQALALALGLANFLSSAEESSASAQLSSLPAMLTAACPFGTPIDTDLHQPSLNQSSSIGSGTVNDRPSPAWRPIGSQGKAAASALVTEWVRAVQYGRRDVPDAWEVYGCISCKCDLEGWPDVSLNATLPVAGVPLQDLFVHPCVSAVPESTLKATCLDVHRTGDSSDEAFAGPYRFQFIPPTGTFRLCIYTASCPIMPVLGLYQLDEEKDVASQGGNGGVSVLNLSLCLSLHESVRNAFEYCTVHIPFFNRGFIHVKDCKVTTGNLDVQKEQALLVWNVGTHFPKSLQASLTGKVITEGQTEHKAAVSSAPFCTGLNAYAKIIFKIQDYTLTGCTVDSYSIQVQPPAKIKVTTAKELISEEYIVWNCLGQAPVAFTPDFSSTV